VNKCVAQRLEPFASTQLETLLQLFVKREAHKDQGFKGEKCEPTIMVSDEKNINKSRARLLMDLCTYLIRSTHCFIA
jgi:hypothetical protein